MTGGGSLIKGTVDLAQEVLGMPVKIGIPTGFRAGLVKEVENPIYSTAVGLILHRLKSNEKAPIEFNSTGKGASLKRIIERMKAWFDEL